MKLSVEKYQRLLHLLDKHMAAYVLEKGIPAAERTKYIADMGALRAELERELKRLLS